MVVMAFGRDYVKKCSRYEYDIFHVDSYFVALASPREDADAAWHPFVALLGATASSVDQKQSMTVCTLANAPATSKHHKSNETEPSCLLPLPGFLTPAKCYRDVGVEFGKGAGGRGSSAQCDIFLPRAGKQ